MMNIYNHPSYIKHRASGKCVEDAICDTQSEIIDELAAALKELVRLNHDWDAGGRATIRFCKANRFAIVLARAALEKLEA